ncbi:MAG: hypothetical protein WC346_13665 [Methanogenium sp.]|jgi:hypothetical protein
MGIKSGIFIIALLLCLLVFTVSAQYMIESPNIVSLDGVPVQTVQPDVSSTDKPTCIPEFPVVALPLGMMVGLLGAAFMLRN